MASLIVCWLIFLGLAGFFPGLDADDDAKSMSDWLGVRFFAGFTSMLVLMVTAQLAFHVALVPAARLVAALSIGGWAVTAYRCKSRPPSIRDLLHPVVLLPSAVLAVAVLRGGIAYQPLAWDELSNWLGWMRQAIQDGYVNSPALSLPANNPVLGYTPGWPVILAFPDLIVGGIDESRSLAIFFLLHAATLGVVHDVVRHALVRAAWPPRQARLGAWAAVLSALTVEATWKLVPTNLLIEEPQSYCLIVCFLLSLTGIVSRRPPSRIGLHTGLAFAAGYLIKLSMLAFALPLLILWAGVIAGERRRFQDALLPTLTLGAPVILVYAMWSVLGTPAMCLSNPLNVLRSAFDGQVPPARMVYVWHRFSEAVGVYLLHYKLALTAISGVGLAVFTIIRRQWSVAAALVVYLGLYFGALYAFHLDCLGDHYLTVMDSTDRYTRVPLRFLQTAGLVLSVVALAPAARKLASNRLAMGILAVYAILLGGWQIVQVEASFASVATRADANPSQVHAVLAVKAESAALTGLVARQPDLGQDVLQISQGSDGYEFVIGRYYGLRRFTLEPEWSWGARSADAWMRSSSEDEMIRTLMTASLVWPIRVDGWMQGILTGLIPDRECRSRVTDYFLVPVPAERSLRCIPKNAS